MGERVVTVAFPMKALRRSSLAAALRYLRTPLRIGVGVIFLVASIGKIRNPYNFLLDVYKYSLVNLLGGKMIAMFIPWTEFVIAVFLLGGLCVRGSLLLASLLLAVFLFAQSYAIAHHIEATCACFNLDSQVSISYWSIARDATILAATVVAFGIHSHRTKTADGAS